ncbi:MAG: hypothetical protein FJX69_01750 [Alphaproteobacteria bacterium]|nr:hypothetical protein [Alphaproteobacteria bacterium]MBM3629390.1 hypothetical protein [Alphaproteobacteria bacterium]
MTAAQIIFSVLNYALAAVVWSCVGRFLLSWFVPAIQPGNYIWRGFVLVTEWAVRVFGALTPSYVVPTFMPLVAAFWLYWGVRPLLLVAFVQAGLSPSLGN